MFMKMLFLWIVFDQSVTFCSMFVQKQARRLEVSGQSCCGQMYGAICTESAHLVYSMSLTEEI